MVARVFSLLLFPQVQIKLSKSAEFINGVEAVKGEHPHREGNKCLLSHSNRLPTCNVRKQVPSKLFNRPGG